MVRQCCAVMCGHDGRKCKMKVFPADEKRAAVWQMNIGRANWKRSPHSSVCECHFDEAQFEEPRPDAGGRRKLRPDAVPLVFPTHVLVVHDPVGDQKWHSPLPADSQPESLEQSTLQSQEIKSEPETETAKPTKPMPRSLKAKREQKLSQAKQNHVKPQPAKPNSVSPMPRPAQSMKPMPKSVKAKRDQKLSQPLKPQPAQPVKPMPKSLKAQKNLKSPQLTKPQPTQPVKPIHKILKAKKKLESPQLTKPQVAQPLKPMPKSLKAKKKLESPQLTKPQVAQPLKPMPKSLKAKKNLDSLESPEPQLAQPVKPMPKSVKAKKKLASTQSTKPQQALLQQPTFESQTSKDLISIQLDHDYAVKSSGSKMCEKFCSIEVMEEIENQVLCSSDENGINQRLQDGSSETVNDTSNSDPSLPNIHTSITPSARIIVNPASRTFINPACTATNGSDFHNSVSPTSCKAYERVIHKLAGDVTEKANARITRSMKAGAIRNDVIDRNVKDKPLESICNGTAKAELVKVTKDVDINGKSTVYRLGIKRKAQMLLSKTPSKLLKTSQSPSSSKSLLRVPASVGSKTSSPSPLPKSSVSSKDVATETEPASPPNPPVPTKDVATETVPSPPPKPSVSSKDVATVTEPMSPPELLKPPPQQLQPPEVWDASDGDVALGSPGLLSDTISFLQFMLPQKWMALAENSGIHVVLLAGKTAKAIQRSVFVPFSGKDIELYVHAMKLSNNSALFGGIRLETRPLTPDSLGDFVDGVVRIVQVFNSYKICNGVAEEEFLQQWRNFHDCILDRNLFGEEGYTQTVRSIDCRYLAPKDSERCRECDIL